MGWWEWGSMIGRASYSIAYAYGGVGNGLHDNGAFGLEYGGDLVYHRR